MENVSWPDSKVTRAVVIGQLNGEHLCRQIGQFLRQVNDFKNTVAIGALPVSLGADEILEA